MRFKGINYDTGFISAGTTTREPFDPDVVRREMEIIRCDLHCDAVRITGGYPERLEIAAACAADAGLEVWFCPFTNNLTGEAFMALLPEFADGAERVRTRGAEVVFLTGSELSLMTAGILPGDTLADRAASLADPHRLRPLIPGVRARINDLLCKSVDVVRRRFGGKLSYASIPLDGVDWTPFDIISTDAGYRTAPMAARFREGIRAFVYTFARYDLVDSSELREDFDRASAGIVRVLDGERRGRRYPDMPWEPKVAFTALADYYRDLDR
ncbi:MAG: hypothetical protein P8020_18925 [Acidobacteriota bacterium]